MPLLKNRKKTGEAIGMFCIGCTDHFSSFSLDGIHLTTQLWLWSVVHRKGVFIGRFLAFSGWTCHCCARASFWQYCQQSSHSLGYFWIGQSRGRYKCCKVGLVVVGGGWCSAWCWLLLGICCLVFAASYLLLTTDCVEFLTLIIVAIPCSVRDKFFQTVVRVPHRSYVY